MCFIGVEVEQETSAQPRPQGFSLKNGWGGKRGHVTSRCQGLLPPHPFFKGKALETRLTSAPPPKKNPGSAPDLRMLGVLAPSRLCQN